MNTQPSRFSQWIRTNLKDSYSGLIAQDIDFFIKNESNKTFVVEEKLYRNAKTGPAQAVIYKMIDQICSTNENFQGVFQISGLSNDRALLNQKEDVNVTSFFRDIENYRVSNNGWYEDVISKYLPYLWDCNGLPKSGKNTAKENTYRRPSALAPLLKNENIPYTSVDWIFVNYCSGNFAIFLENPPNQLTTEFVTLFENYNSEENDFYNPRSQKKYNYVGSYQLSHSNDFEIFKINNNTLNRNEAVRLLNLDTRDIVNYQN